MTILDIFQSASHPDWSIEEIEHEGVLEFHDTIDSQSLTWAKVADVDVRGATFRTLSFAHSMCETWDFSGATLEAVSLNSTVFDECCFDNVDFSTVSIDHCTFRDCSFVGANLDKVRFRHTEVTSCNFIDASLRGTRFGVFSGLTGSLWPNTDTVLIFDWFRYAIHLQKDRVAIGCVAESPGWWMSLTQEDFMRHVNGLENYYAIFENHKDEWYALSQSLEPYPEEV